MADNNKKKSAEAAEAKEAKKNTASKEKTNKKNDKAAPSKDKKGNVFARAWAAIKKFCKDIKGECKKVVWPDAKTVLKSTGIVLLCVAVLGVIIWLIDMGLSQGIDAVVNLAKNSNAETTTQAQGMIHGFFGI